MSLWNPTCASAVSAAVVLPWSARTFSSAAITAFSRSSRLWNACCPGCVSPSPAIGRDCSSSASASSAPALVSRELRQRETPQMSTANPTIAPATASDGPLCAATQPMKRPARTWNSSGFFSCLRSSFSAKSCLLQDGPFSRNSPVKSIAV